MLFSHPEILFALIAVAVLIVVFRPRQKKAGYEVKHGVMLGKHTASVQIGSNDGNGGTQIICTGRTPAEAEAKLRNKIAGF